MTIINVNFYNARIMKMLKHFYQTNKLPDYISYNKFLNSYKDLQTMLKEWSYKIEPEYHTILNDIMIAYTNLNTVVKTDDDKIVETLNFNNDIEMILKTMECKKIKFSTPTIKADPIFKSELLTVLKEVAIIYKKILKKEVLTSKNIFIIIELKKKFDVCQKAISSDMLKIDKILDKYKDYDLNKSNEYVMLQNLRSELELMFHGTNKMEKFLGDKLFQ